MDKDQMKKFLRQKPGYFKEGSKRLKNILLKHGIEASIKDCKDALKECRIEGPLPEVNKNARVLIYDIETSPNIGWFWRSGYKLNIGPHQIIKERAVICVSYKWLGEKQVFNLTWDEDQCDRFLIEQFVEVLNEADLIVAHNGDRFDLKWLKTRALFHRIPMLPNYKSFDTLKVVKSKLYLNSNRLDYIAKLLGHEGKIETTPDLWNKVCILNDRKALIKMVEYCDEDVIQLEKIYNEIKYLDNPKIHAGVLDGKSKETSPVTGGTNIEHVKKVTTNRGTVKHIMKDLDTDRYFEMSDTNYKKYKK